MIKCLSEKCNYKIHSNVRNNGGKHCCNRCKNRSTSHNGSCEKVPFISNIITNPIIPPVIPNPITPSKNLKKALLIGINYINDPRNTLYGCINDVINIQAKLRTANPECKEYRILRDDARDPLLKPTRKNIIDGINWLVTDLKSNESIFFHYSGHGGLTLDRSGDETSGFDSCIYPIDNAKIEIITDDELRVMLVNKIPTGGKAFVVLDCCHSGSALDLRYMISAPQYGTILINQNDKYPSTNGSVIFLSGCKDNQTAADTVNSVNMPTGALTNALLEVWNQYGMNIKFKYLLWDVRAILKRDGYSQIPQLSCSNNINIGDEFRL
jgi:hypothetical protein